MEDLVPSEFYLSQNSPNPFKEITRIKYCLPVKSKVNLALFDSNGKKMKELVNKIQEAGTYEVKLDGHDFADGFYNYRLLACDSGSGQVFVKAKKMLLAR